MDDVADAAEPNGESRSNDVSEERWPDRSVNAGEGLLAGSKFSNDLRETNGDRGGRPLENFDGLPRFTFIGVGSGPKPPPKLPKPPKPPIPTVAPLLPPPSAEKLAENLAFCSDASGSGR